MRTDSTVLHKTYTDVLKTILVARLPNPNPGEYETISQHVAYTVKKAAQEVDGRDVRVEMAIAHLNNNHRDDPVGDMDKAKDVITALENAGGLTTEQQHSHMKIVANYLGIMKEEGENRLRSEELFYTQADDLVGPAKDAAKALQEIHDRTPVRGAPAAAAAAGDDGVVPVLPTP